MRLSAGHPAAQLAFVAAVSLIAYVGALPRYFVSEDFTLLGFLSQRSFWENAAIHLTEPLLGITFVPFYRPVSAMALDLELHLWGTWSTGFAVTHFLVHLGNTVLLHRIARRLSDGDDAVAFAAAALFALYPLHPNAVVFIGSFATLFSATACLASLLLFLRGRAGGDLRALAGAWSCFALALGSYEAAAVLPALLLATELLSAGPGPARAGRRALCLRHLPFFAILTAYLLARRAVLGSSAGAAGDQLSGLATMLGASGSGFDWARFVYPAYDAPIPEPVKLAATVLVAAATVLSLAVLARNRLTGRDGGSAEARLWLLAVIWILAAQLPYRDLDVVPGTGRFWYFSSAGLGFLVAAALRTLTPRRMGRAAVLAGTLLLGAVHCRLLHGNVGVHAEAGRTAKAIQSRVQATAAAADPASTGRRFLTGYPSHLVNGRGTPLAQVFHWGLSDAMRPPFIGEDLRVYPLPPLPTPRLAPLVDRPDLGQVLTWSDGELRPLAPEAARPDPRIRVLLPADGEVSEGGRMRFTAPEAARYNFVVIARGNVVTRPIPADTPSGALEGRLPIKFIESMSLLYDDEIFWWIEALDVKGRPLAFSPLRTVVPRSAIHHDLRVVRRRATAYDQPP